MAAQVGEMRALGREIETSTKEIATSLRGIATRRIAIAMLDREMEILLCKTHFSALIKFRQATPESDSAAPESYPAT
jgi:hypothetical protein